MVRISLALLDNIKIGGRVGVIRRKKAFSVIIVVLLTMWRAEIPLVKLNGETEF